MLHNFTGGTSDGANPYSGVVIGEGGVLYGTTFYAGTGSCNFLGSGCGIVFSLTPPAAPGGSWAEAVLYNFTGSPSDGANPYAGVVISVGGVLYGTTGYGGTGSSFFGYGTVFSLTPPATSGGSWTETVLHNFTGSPSDGESPSAGVVIGKGGVLYGTTSAGGTAYNGTVFSLTPQTTSLGAWTETVLLNFTTLANAGVVIGKGGVLYGTTNGGSTNYGTVFSLTPPATQGGSWTETVLHNFTGSPSDGANPYAGVVIGESGELYGTTEYGGTGSSFEYGTVFLLTPPYSVAPYSTPEYAGTENVWSETVLHNFAGSPSDGATPLAGVVIGKGGVLYGTTYSGGTSGYGTVFALRP